MCKGCELEGVSSDSYKEERIPPLVLTVGIFNKEHKEEIEEYKIITVSPVIKGWI